MKATALQSFVRQGTGKGPSRRLRAKGMVPSVFYGPQAAAAPISVSTEDLQRLLKHREENVFIRLAIHDGEQATEKLTMIKEIQVEPVSGKLRHVDFYEVRMDQKIAVDLPLHFTGRPEGLDEGGELQHLKRDIRVSCLPANLPEFLEIDISSLRIGHALRVSDILIPEGISVLDPGDIAIAVINATRSSRSTTGEEQAEPAADQASSEG